MIGHIFAKNFIKSKIKRYAATNGYVAKEVPY
jgi:hypothetical protein